MSRRWEFLQRLLLATAISAALFAAALARAEDRADCLPPARQGLAQYLSGIPRLPLFAALELPGPIPQKSRIIPVWLEPLRVGEITEVPKFQLHVIGEDGGESILHAPGDERRMNFSPFYVFELPALKLAGAKDGDAVYGRLRFLDVLDLKGRQTLHGAPVFALDGQIHLPEMSVGHDGATLGPIAQTSVINQAGATGVMSGVGVASTVPLKKDRTPLRVTVVIGPDTTVNLHSNRTIPALRGTLEYLF